MSFLLDTCVISETIKSNPSEAVQTWMKSIDETVVYLSVFTLAELEKGIQKMEEGKKRRFINEWVHQDLMIRFAGRVLSVDQDVAWKWGNIQAEAEKLGRPMPIIDGFIAATALTHKLTLVTRNISDMEAVGVSLFNPWTD